MRRIGRFRFSGGLQMRLVLLDDIFATILKPLRGKNGIQVAMALKYNS